MVFSVSRKDGLGTEASFPTGSRSLRCLLFTCLKLYHTITTVSLIRMRPLGYLSILDCVYAKKISRYIVKYPDTWHMFHLLQMLETPCFYEVQVLGCIEALLFASLIVQRVVRTEEVIVVVQGQVVLQCLVQSQGGLISPAPRHILHCVPTTTEDHRRQAP